MLGLAVTIGSITSGPVNRLPGVCAIFATKLVTLEGRFLAALLMPRINDSDLRSRKRSYLAQRGTSAPRVRTSNGPGPRTTTLATIIVRPVESPRPRVSRPHYLWRKLMKRTETFVLGDNTRTCSSKDLEPAFDRRTVPSRTRNVRLRTRWW